MDLLDRRRVMIAQIQEEKRGINLLNNTDKDYYVINNKTIGYVASNMYYNNSKVVIPKGTKIKVTAIIDCKIDADISSHNQQFSIQLGYAFDYQYLQSYVCGKYGTPIVRENYMVEKTMMLVNNLTANANHTGCIVEVKVGYKKGNFQLKLYAEIIK